MATENDLQDNIGDGGQDDTRNFPATGKIKVVVIDPNSGRAKQGVDVIVQWIGGSANSDSSKTDADGAAPFDIPPGINGANLKVGTNINCTVSNLLVQSQSNEVTFKL